MSLTHRSTFQERVPQVHTQNIVDKEMSKHLVAVGTASTDIAKIIKVHRNMATRWIKENEPANAWEEPPDEVAIINVLKSFFATTET